MVAALVGVAAGGVIGGVFAVPLLGATKAIYLALRTPDLEVAAAGWVPPSDELPSPATEQPLRPCRSHRFERRGEEAAVHDVRHVSSMASCSNSSRRDTRK